MREADPELAAVIERVGSYALEMHETGSLFEAMLRSVVYQQLHGKAAASILTRVRAELERHGGVTPEAATRASDKLLRAAGLSQNKLLAIRDLAARCRDGTVPTFGEAQDLNDNELIERLTIVRGIGPWTVHMLMIFHLGRPDVMPTGDFAIRLAFKKIYRKRKDPTPDLIVKHARRWQPYRSIASWYLWRSLDTNL